MHLYKNSESMNKTTQLLSTNHVLMVDPVGFGYNEETAESNAFQHLPNHHDISQIEYLARKEFEQFAHLLNKNGITVHVLEGKIGLPDAVFPNNLFSTDRHGTWVDYPMMAANRQMERALYPRTFLEEKGFEVHHHLDLTTWESKARFLEGTGSLILQPQQKSAWLALSPRAHLDVAQDWAQQTGYALHTFETSDLTGKSVYHTNVIMSIGTQWHFICPEMIPHFHTIKNSLEELHSTEIQLSAEQVYQFCGNVLEVRNDHHTPFGILSSTAWNALNTQQKRAWEQFVQPLIVDIPTIEKIGGGSARCMLAEIFLPHKYSKSITT